MNKKATALISFVLLLTLVFASFTVAYALEEKTEAGFAVRPSLPENQTDTDLSYFSLRMAPAQQERLTVDVLSQADENINIGVSLVDASTSGDGKIDFTTPGVRDETLAHPFTELAKLAESSFTLEGGKAKSVYVDLTMPAELLDGTILGSIVFTKLSSDGSPGEVVYVIDVVLSETDTAIPPDFELTGIKAERVDAGPAIVHSIRNKNAAIASDVTLDINILDKDTGQSIAQDSATIEMAPNSVMPYAVMLGEDQIAAGEYTSEIHMEADGETWDFTQDFALSVQDVSSLSQQSASSTSTALPTWAVILIVAVTAVIVILFILIAAVKSRRRKKRDLAPPRPRRESPPPARDEKAGASRMSRRTKR